IDGPVIMSGHFAPGVAGPGIFHAQNSVSFGFPATFDLDINGTTSGTQYDQVGGGSAFIGNNVTLNLTLGFTPVAGNSFTIIKNDTNVDITGAFDGLPEGKIFNVTSGSFKADLQITYQGGDGNDVVLTAVNVAPTLDPITNQTVTEEAPLQSIDLTGISAG